MLIIGAGGHAKEILEVLADNGEENFFFYDDLPTNSMSRIFKQFSILKNEKEASSYFKKKDKRFVLGLGGTKARMFLAEKMCLCGGELNSVISLRAYISKFDTFLGGGINIMQKVTIQPSVKIGKGCLINANTNIHHDTILGDYCEVGPSVVITGRCIIGDFTSIGAGAILKPGITIGKNVIIGAGAVVTRSIPENIRVAGVPAIPIP